MALAHWENPQPETFSEAEEIYRSRGKVLVAARDLPAGHTLRPGDWLHRISNAPGLSDPQAITQRRLSSAVSQFASITEDRLERNHS